MWSLSDRAMAGSARRVASATAPRLAVLARIARGCLLSGRFQKKLPGTRPIPLLTDEGVHVDWRSASAFYPCHKCACFSLGFDSHDVIVPNDSRDSGERNSCSSRGVIRFFLSF